LGCQFGEEGADLVADLVAELADHLDGLACRVGEF
jgi:hypothetical protein